MTQCERYLRYLFWKARPVNIGEIFSEIGREFATKDFEGSGGLVIHHGIANWTGRTSELRDCGLETYDKAAKTYFFPKGETLESALEKLRQRESKIPKVVTPSIGGSCPPQAIANVGKTLSDAGRTLRMGRKSGNPKTKPPDGFDSWGQYKVWLRTQKQVSLL